MFNFVDRTIISVLGEAIRRDLKLSDLQLGMLGDLSFALFYAALGIRLAERRSRVRIIAAVTAIWSVMTALSGMAGSFVQLLACRAGVAVGEAGFTPSLVSMLSDRFAPNRRAAVFSMIALGAPLGAATAAILQDDWRLLVALMFLASAALYAFLPTIMTVTQRLVEPRMRASTAALHAFAGDYAGMCLGKTPVMPACMAASAQGLQYAMIAAGAVLMPAIALYLIAARALPREIRD